MSVEPASPRSDHVKIHVKNTACSYWYLSNLFLHWEQVQPIFGTLGGLTILCSVIYGGTVADGLSITVQPQFSAEPRLLSLCPHNPCGSSHHLHWLWSRSTSLEFASGRTDIQLEELLSEIRWERSLNSTMHVHGCVTGTQWRIARVLCAPDGGRGKVCISCTADWLGGDSPELLRGISIAVAAWGRFWSKEMLLGFLLIFNDDWYFLKHLR